MTRKGWASHILVRGDERTDSMNRKQLEGRKVEITMTLAPIHVGAQAQGNL